MYTKDEFNVSFRPIFVILLSENLQIDKYMGWVSDNYFYYTTVEL
jgi:hypothetical protein